MATPAELDALIVAQQTHANTLATDAITGINTELAKATAIAAGIDLSVQPWTHPGFVTLSDIPDPVAPTDTTYTNEVRTAFDYALLNLNAQTQGQLQTFLTTFFPDIAQAVKDNSDNWIASTILNGQFVPVAVENAIWNRARDREAADALRQQDEAVNTFASRGFTMPTGALNAAVLAVQEGSARKLASISRDVAIKDFEIANENTKFAVEQAVRLRTSFLAAMGDFLRIGLTMPSAAVDYSKTMLSAKQAVFDAAMRLYQGRISETTLGFNAASFNTEMTHKYDLLNEQQWLDKNTAATKIAEIQINEALKAVDALAGIASGALQTQNTMLTNSAQTQ